MIAPEANASLAPFAQGDNHLVELAVAGGASHIVTHNLRDLKHMELKFPGLAIATPTQLLAKERAP